MDYEMEGVRPRNGLKKTWSEAVEKRLHDLTTWHGKCYRQ